MLKLVWFLNVRFIGKLISMCGNINTKKFPSLASKTMCTCKLLYVHLFPGKKYKSKC